MITRRLFLGGLLTAGATAPAIVRSGVLMPVRPAIVVPPFDPIFLHSQVTRDELIGVIDDAKRLADEVSRVPLIHMELGVIENFRFIASPPLRWSARGNPRRWLA